VGPTLGLTVEVVEPVVVGGRPASSTRIRQAVGQADLREAASLLGRPFSVLGTVVAGEGRGQQLGFATANLDLHHEACPREGVYVGRALVKDVWRPAAVSVGSKPTFGEARRPVVEVHVLDFADRIGGQTVEVEFLARIRDQERFPNQAALAEQIGRDVAAVRSFFAECAGPGAQEGP